MSYWTHGVTLPSLMSDGVSVLIFVRDLMFSSKVVATARAEGVAFRVVRDFSILIQTPAPRLIVDLNEPGRLEQAVQWKQAFGGHVTGFVSHVAADTIAAAKAAGIDRVMSNGAFAGSLPQVLRGDA